MSANYITVSSGQTNYVLGSVGAAGDKLEKIIAVVSTSLTGAISIKDGNGSAISLCPANLLVGTWVIELGLQSGDGGWKISTGSGVTAICIGNFS